MTAWAILIFLTRRNSLRTEMPQLNWLIMQKCIKNLIICAQAPLTNIALATLMDNNFPKNVKHLYIMGGTYRHAGNITPAAEYNFSLTLRLHILYLNLVSMLQYCRGIFALNMER
ncbi:nucleoside hydrolase [Acidiplasma cupricumulans]|uniref:nucleoside hydrolase n=1 Tax=Acidiplasma cupricumulans TaxID=312540 RepID=UPI000785EB6C|nr:nucleoside hydrolase [Acidiplasma cupricumulans]